MEPPIHRGAIGALLGPGDFPQEIPLINPARSFGHLIYPSLLFSRRAIFANSLAAVRKLFMFIFAFLTVLVTAVSVAVRGDCPVMASKGLTDRLVLLLWAFQPHAIF